MAYQSDPGRRGEGEGPPLTADAATIAAVATAAGRGGIGVVRVSGPLAAPLARSMLGSVPAPRHAVLSDFRGSAGELIDRGIAIYFAAPHSYTGEDILELQGHGGPVVLDLLLRRCIEFGARPARPGEFTQRAFLNERLDLAQAESVADLIEAASAQAALSAVRSLTGEFSGRVHALVEELTQLRMHVEACIDFPEEEIDPADRALQHLQLSSLRDSLRQLLERATQGAVLRDGLTVVLAGAPNVGKSSLLNRLAGEDVAIVTPIAGTTRDYVRATIILEGVPIHLIDTAGLRETRDVVERIGVERTWKAIEEAGAIVLLEAPHGGVDPLFSRLPTSRPTVRVRNKIDLRAEPPSVEGTHPVVISLSAKTGAGVDLLRAWLLQVAGWRPHEEGVFMARQRHLGALRDAQSQLDAAENTQPFELKAEHLRLAQAALGQITGEVSADTLLGQIFSRFCIGK